MVISLYDSEIFTEFMKLRANSTEEISLVDTVTIIPEKTYNTISGIPQKPEEKKLPRIKQKLNFDETVS